ncbi:uncharacterized protein MYCGRDRAFT_97656 [Zymoseptoria tritici IPO323]|uniref:Uncharacterized protein n=1 Tax=Zymoseptoria tritici (strain CBS 115943 / IPO323) TaxID=336722 RepID=F9XQW7_ZYMTI|nr:uncharacterized protein MYCGRDRAFT_97656 [Zymoseptoria tritici IPO323]EGP82303.1 hypothetical protein MYCGRDRAFT_97656 [Zymoseptoria tritici IPO323]
MNALETIGWWDNRRCIPLDDHAFGCLAEVVTNVKLPSSTLVHSQQTRKVATAVGSERRGTLLFDQGPTDRLRIRPPPDMTKILGKTNSGSVAKSIAPRAPKKATIKKTAAEKAAPKKA